MPLLFSPTIGSDRGDCAASAGRDIVNDFVISLVIDQQNALLSRR
jgi:hypothetical protein